MALVSGSTRGIGKAIALELVDSGYIVVQNARKLCPSDELVGSKLSIADVTDLDQCRKLVESVIREFGRLDLLVCNVGSGKRLDDNVRLSESWNHFIRVNLDSAVFLIEASLDALIQSKGSAIAISSICGLDPTVDSPIEYACAKSALDMYIRKMALTHSKSGVRFNAVAPGNVMFEGSVWDTRFKDEPEITQSYIYKKVPLGTFVCPDEVAKAVTYLAGCESRSITGIVLPIDGGQSL